MKALSFLFSALTVTSSFAQEVIDVVPDPTLPSSRIRAALTASGSAIPEINLRGVILAAGRERGLIMFEIPGAGQVLVRPGMPFVVTTDGESRKLTVNAITSDGIEVEAPAQKETILIPCFGPVRNQLGGRPGEVDYVEYRDLPLLDALRMLSDQTGSNYSASVDANKILVNVMLRNVSASSVVEEICKSHNLWFKRDPVSGITRIMSIAEFERDLVGFREEQTEVFTLKFPNVPEVATAIADLFGDRVQLSLGVEETEENTRRDLEQRFDRFDILNQRAQGGANQGGNIVGNNVSGFYSGGGSTNGFGGFSGSRSGEGYGRERYDRRRLDRTVQPAVQADEELFRDLTPEQAQRVERALTAPAGTAVAADIEALRKRPATIFVTASKRNNMIVVRTADTRSLDDIRVLIRRMDVQTPMVLLEVKVVSIELGNEFRSAFDYQFSDGTTSAAFTRDNVAAPPVAGAFLGGGLNSSDMTFTIMNNNFRARMQLFEQKNRVKTLATPMLLTANNEVSRLFLGEERPLVRGINSQTIITDNNVATTPNTTTEFRAVGNTLLITPNINADRTVTLRLVQENSFISPNAASIPVVTSGGTGNSTVQNVKVDVVGTRSVSGTFVAKDGLAVAIGGMIEETDIDRRAQVPLLGDIPGLGLLFRRQEKVKSRRELVIIIRPYVMTTPADSEVLSQAVLERLAPVSVDRLMEEGFLPARPEVTTEVIEHVPLVPLDSKQTVPVKKATIFR